MKKQLFFCLTAVIGISTVNYAQQNSISTNGNVGIGTTAPQVRLEVAGKVKIDSTLVVRDSVTIKKNLRVEQNVHFLGQTRMNNSRVYGNFISETNARFDGAVRFPALELPNNMNNKNIVITNANGLAQKVPFDTVANILKSNIYAEPAQVDFY
ncbi:MAG TPA: hypothetical protein VKZ44_03310, partial [Taishania sp.]|nr:hypothetical protein [Taishania sp.]